MKNYTRIILLVLFDALLLNIALAIAVILRSSNGYETALQQLMAYFKLAPVIIIAFLPVFYFFKLYNRVWAYASLGEMMAIIQAVTWGSLGTVIVTYFFFSPIPRFIVIVHWAYAILLVGGSRMVLRINYERQKSSKTIPSKRTLIIGAGDAGAMVVREMKTRNSDILPVGFIDDDSNKHNLTIMGLPVLGKREQIPDIVRKYKIELIVIAMPSVGASAVRDIVEICRSTKAELKILPGVYQIIEGQVSVSSLRPVQLEDLLRREPVQVDLKEIAGYLKKETILITGAGGSIGSELCRQVATFGPSKLILLGHGENSIHKIWMELHLGHLSG